MINFPRFEAPFIPKFPVASNPVGDSSANGLLAVRPAETPAEPDREQIDFKSLLGNSFKQLLDTVKAAETPDEDKKARVLDFISAAQNQLFDDLGLSEPVLG
jgi:hypothetical protein